MVAAMVMDTMAILVATATVTGIVITAVQGVTIVIGDETKAGGKVSHLLRPSPCSVDIPTQITPTYCFRTPPGFCPAYISQGGASRRQENSLVGNA